MISCYRKYCSVPYSLEQVEKTRDSLTSLIELIRERNTRGLRDYFHELRRNLGIDGETEV